MMDSVGKRIAASGIGIIAIATECDVSEISKRLIGLCWDEEDGYEITNLALSNKAAKR